MTEKEVKWLILVFNEIINQQEDGLISVQEAYDYIKDKVKVVSPNIKKWIESHK